MDTQLVETPVAIVKNPSNMVHLTCCVDFSIALCGFTEFASSRPQEENDCIVCEDISHTNTCPRHGKCLI